MFATQLVIYLVKACLEYNKDPDSKDVLDNVDRYAETGDIQYLKDAYGHFYACTGFLFNGMGYNQVMSKL